jgi:hypothetical protein
MKKRKTDLFRFVTLRTPELISDERKDLGFVTVQIPTPTSTFLQLIDESDLVASRTSLLAATQTFAAFETVQGLKDLLPEMWEFSMWLAKNKNAIDRTELDTVVPPQNIAGGDQATLWDNLFYDILTESNPYVRQACLQLLVANNFFNKYLQYSPGTTTVEEELAAEVALLKRLANGKVIVHRVFSLEKQEITSGNLDFNFASRKSLKVQHYANMANCRVQQLTQVQDELIKYEKQYNTDFNAAYTTALDQHKAAAQLEVQRFIDENPEIEAKEENIPDTLNGSLVFNFDSPFSQAYSTGKLSAQAIDYIEENNLGDASTQEVLSHIAVALGQNKVQASKTQRKQVKNVLINGVLTKPSKSKVHDYAFSFEKDKFDDALGEYQMFLSVDAGYEGAFLTSYDYSLTIGETTLSSAESGCPKILCVNNQVIFIELLTNQALNFNDCEELLFQANLQLDNGKEIKIYKKGNTNVLFYTGAALAVTGDSTTVEHYGVNRIGVADYRRVEQELCCYIPGEVSHIENVLAREYKEKSTRSLTRSENTFESTSEREVEEMSDTESTSRHEMSTEISEVLQKDRSQNYGFNASVSGKILDSQFDTSGYGDFSFAQSATDSNTEARTYAEDVTRRALERIVQKTSVKRTSKILREFEENNKHGFDNREGTEHVTGVYRWVDKVYKNSIVNYGKRLMYEFMIPEPSRWYKEAVIIQAEEEETSLVGSGAVGTSGVALQPTPLSENGINSPSDITRENYQAKAALYGANPEAPQDEKLTITGSGSASYGNGDAPQSNTHDPIIIPPNYVCKAIVGQTDFNIKADMNPAGYLTVNIGGRTWSDPVLTGSGARVLVTNATGLNLTGNVPMSAVTRKVTSYSISASFRCELQPSIFQQWQQDVFDEIKQAYDAQLQAFNDAQAESAAIERQYDVESEEENKIAGNPRFNAGIVNTELKRLAIEMLSKPFGLEQGKNFYNVSKCDVPELELTRALDVYSSHVKFFEQAFDWELMSKKFYPYYWADKCDWKSLFQAQDSEDYAFQQFLQSGMGRIIVPVKAGFEDAVTFFMETGKVWSGTGLVVDTDNDLYVSIVDELTKVEGRIEGEEWDTIVPSSLTIVQKTSVKLTEGGLPCCETDQAVIDATNLSEDTVVLTRDTGTTSA